MFSPMHKPPRVLMQEENYGRTEIWYVRQPSHHVIRQVISGRLAQTCADLGRRKKFVSDIASHTPWRKSSLRKTSALRNLKGCCNLRPPCCERPGEHKSSARGGSVLARVWGQVTRNARRGLCRSDFLATRVYISDRVSDITRPYVSCVIWCWRRPRSRGRDQRRETTQRSINFDQTSRLDRKLLERHRLEKLYLFMRKLFDVRNATENIE